MTMKTKRIASLLLSAALLLSLAVPAFAENPTTEETAEPENRRAGKWSPEALTRRRCCGACCRAHRQKRVHLCRHR